MVIGCIVFFLIWYFSKSILFGILGFYFATGIRKSSLWLGIPEYERHMFLPPLVQSYSLASFILGILLWPIVVGFRGDPMNDFFQYIDNKQVASWPNLNKEEKEANTDITNHQGEMQDSQPSVKLTSRLPSEWLREIFKDFIDDIDSLDYVRDTEFIDELEDIDFEYHKCVKKWAQILKNELPIQNLECYIFEISIFLFFEINLCMMFENKTPKQLQNIINKRFYTYIKSISTHITGEHIKKRVQSYANSLDHLYITRRIHESCLEPLYEIFTTFYIRAYKRDNICETIEEKYVKTDGLLSVRSDKFTDITDIPLQRINNLLNKLKEKQLF